jgi:hypothetical protein
MKSKIFVVTAIVALGFVPVLFRELFGASSLALGLFVIVSFILVFSLKFLIVEKVFRLQKIFVFFIFLIYIFLVLGISNELNAKSIASIFLLTFFLVVAKYFSRKVVADDIFNKKNTSYIFLALMFFLIITVISDSYFSKLIYERSKGVFPFGEPSNFALFFGPFFLLHICHLPSNFKRFLIVLVVAILASSIQSMTLLIYVVLSLGLIARFSVLNFLIFIPTSIFGLYFILNDPYFLTRMILSPDSDNLTVLVYLQGLFSAYNALIDTNGFGLGFQMLGTQPLSEIGYKIMAILNQGRSGEGLNRQDGGFVAAKLVAEFGVLGLCFLLYYIFLFFRVFFKLRKVICQPQGFEASYLFSLVFIYTSFVEVFVRGSGYFSPSLFLFFVALFILSYYQRRAKYFANRYC